jgi:16S rRNA (uracil1498-N3)-methyltransferase
MSVFYSPFVTGDFAELDEKESGHAVRVLRLKAGDAVNLVDGKGGWYKAVIDMDNPKRCRLKILSHVPDHHPLPYSLHLAISPVKSSDRFEWFLEKATEIGISEITPLLCHRTGRTRMKTGRLERIIVSAMKQSLKAYKPVLHQVTPFTEFVAVNREGFLGIAHCVPVENGSSSGDSSSRTSGDSSSRTSGDSSSRISISRLPRDSKYTLMVGPEGDFTDEEVRAAIESGYGPFHLGDSRLRTETAGVYICAALNLRYL